MGTGCCSMEQLQRDKALSSHLPEKLTSNNNTLTLTSNNTLPLESKESVDLTEYQNMRQQLTEYKQKCNELQSENMELILTLNKLVTAHHSWDWETVVEWMTTIDNGTFLPYKDILMKNLKAEDISGKDLVQLELDDLHRLGVTSTVHKKRLLSLIKKLTKNDSIEEAAFDPELAHSIRTPSTIYRVGTEMIDHDILRKMTTRLTEMDFSDIKIQFTHSLTETFDKNESIYEDPVPSVAKRETVSVDKWKYTDGVLLITVIKAKGFNEMEEKSDIYVEVALKGDYWHKETTKVSNEMEPVWNERFQLFTADPKTDIFNVTIWKKKRIFDEKIGIVDVNVIDVLNSDGFIDKEYDIMESTYGGILQLELIYKEISK